ncbi:MAG: hypothetical protein ACK4JF_03075 [Methylohalobius sp.]
MTPWEQLFDRLRGRIEDLGKLGTDGMKDHAYLEKPKAQPERYLRKRQRRF